MGNTCAGSGIGSNSCTGSYYCQYRIYDSPQNDTEYKMNAMVDVFCGFQTSQDILFWVQKNFLSGLGYNSIYPLIFPPALQYIPAVNSNVKNDGTSRVLNQNEYTMVCNPYWAQAQIIQNLMYGQSQSGAMPCAQWYNVPFSYTGQGVPVFTNVLNPAYCQCLEVMYKNLESPLPTSGQCVDGEGATLVTNTYSADLIQDQITNYSTVILQCLTAAQIYPWPKVGWMGSADNCIKYLFASEVIGPYDTAITAPCINSGSPEPSPCSDINSPTCTYSICQANSTTGGGWNCTPLTGRCQWVPAGGTFSTLEECENCQANGTCPGSNICCPEAQAPTYLLCSASNNPPPSSGFVKPAMIGLAIIAVMAMLLAFVIWYIKRRFSK